MSEEKKHECSCCFMCGMTGAIVYKDTKLHKQCIAKYEAWLERCKNPQPNRYLPN